MAQIHKKFIGILANILKLNAMARLNYVNDKYIR